MTGWSYSSMRMRGKFLVVTSYVVTANKVWIAKQFLLVYATVITLIGLYNLYLVYTDCITV